MDTQEALNKAARLVEEEAILFEEEAAELKRDLGSEEDSNRDTWAACYVAAGRAISLRLLARQIRLIH